MPRSIRSLFAALAMLPALAAFAHAEALTLAVVKAEGVSDIATGEPVVSIVFDAASTEALATFTRDNVGRQVVIRVDGEDVMSPVIREPILGGEVRITGNMTMDDARSLAARLSAGEAAVEIELAGG